MNEKIKTLLLGIILTILIINTSVILSLVFGSIGKYQDSQVRIEPTPTIKPITTTKPNLTIPEPEENMLTSVQTPVPTPTKPYVYIESAPSLPTSKRSRSIFYDEQPKVVNLENFTFYSLTNQKVTQTLPRVSFNLVNPPLIIDYDITPQNFTDVKYVEYKILSQKYKVNSIVVRPYENTWFTIIVRDRNTGEIVAEDGVGGTYSLQSPKQLIIYKKGNYRFEFSGDYATVNLTMKVKKEGNIP